MKVLVIGAAGMIGAQARRAARRAMARWPAPRSTASRRSTSSRRRRRQAPFPIATEACDIAALYVPGKLAAARPDVVFLLASVVSGEAEADFDKGYGINLDGTRMIFEALRREQALSGGAYARASCSPPPSPCSARRSRTRSATSSSPRR